MGEIQIKLVEYEVTKHQWLPDVGQGQQVDYFSNKLTDCLIPLDKFNKQKLVDCLYKEDVLDSSDNCICTIDEKKKTITLVVTVDENNVEATPEQLQDWKQGILELYILDITVWYECLQVQQVDIPIQELQSKGFQTV